MAGFWMKECGYPISVQDYGKTYNYHQSWLLYVCMKIPQSKTSNKLSISKTTIFSTSKASCSKSLDFDCLKFAT